MNKQTLAACTFAAITLGVSSCFLFEKSKPQISEKTIIGKWNIDSVDTSNFKPLGEEPVEAPLFLEPAFSYSPGTTIAFSTDSIYTMYGTYGVSEGSNKYYFDSAAQKLFVRDDGTFIACNVTIMNDSMLDVEIYHHGVHYIMKKQP